MAKIDMTAVLGWTKQADLIFQTPLIRLAVLPLLKAMLPPMGVTPAQMARLDQNYDDLLRREAEARRRASLKDDGA